MTLALFPAASWNGGELLFGIEGDAGGRPSVADGIAVRDVLGIAGDRPVGLGHAGYPAHFGEERFGDRIADGVATAVEDGLAPDLEVDVLVDVTRPGS